MNRRWAAILLLLVVGNGNTLAQVVGTPGPEPRLPPQSGMAAPVSTAGFVPRSGDPFGGSVPRGAATAQELALSLRNAVAMGLKNNLGLLLSEQASRSAEGEWWKQRSALLPNLAAGTVETLQQINLQAFGFGGFPGLSTIVGPFGVFDTRVSVSQPLVDLSAWRRTSAAAAGSAAAHFTYQDAREMVVWAVSNLYFRARAGSGRVEAARRQLQTAEALFRQASDFKDAGVVPAIEVLRAQVELEAEQQRLIYFENELEKQELDLARAIGVPVGQKIRLTEELSEAPPPAIEITDALQQAYAARADYQSLQQRVREAELEKRAAESERLPRLTARGDYGDIGRAPGVSHGTFSAAASLEFPLFQGGRIHGNILEAGAALAGRQAELENLRARIEYELRVALLDLKAAQQQVEVARNGRELATQQMEQSQDRFAAGVTSNIEVVQAQEALATANENFISSLYSFNIAKASLARAMGAGEKNLPAAGQGESK